MASKHIIPMGDLPDAEIKSGLNAATQRTQATLKSRLGTEFQISARTVILRHEVAANNKKVELKHLTQEVHLRRGLFDGATVKLIWTRRKKGEATIVFDSGVEFEKYLFGGAFVGALLLAGVLAFLTRLVNGGRIVVFFLFLALLPPMLIPYVVFRITSRFRNQKLIDEVASIVKSELHS